MPSDPTLTEALETIRDLIWDEAGLSIWLEEHPYADLVYETRLLDAATAIIELVRSGDLDGVLIEALGFEQYGWVDLLDGSLKAAPHPAAHRKSEPLYRRVQRDDPQGD